MPKRKYSDMDSDDEIYKELRRIKKKLRRRTRRKRRSSSKEYSSPRSQSEDRDGDLTWLRDKDDAPQINSVVIDTRAVEPPVLATKPDATRAVEPPVLAIEPHAHVTRAVEPPVLATEPDAPVPEASMAEASVPEMTEKSEAIPSTSVQTELDVVALEILGADPSIEVQYGKDINKDLAIRFEHTVVTGLSKELRKDLITKYLTPANCTLIDPPTLNAEIKAASSELVIKRDKAIEFKQRQLAAAISCLGEAISRLLARKDRDPELLKLLMDASRIVCDCQHTDSNTRRNFMLSTLKNDMKAQLQNTKIDKFLFGDNLQETIKLAKVINKSGIELKSSTSTSKISSAQAGKSSQAGRNKNSHLNWKGPFPSRRATGAPRTREPAADPSTPSSSRAHASTHRQRSSYRSSRPRNDTYRR